MNKLRNIAVVVTEPATGHFVWQLREAETLGSDGWNLLRQARSGRAEWLDAFNDGIDEVLLLAIEGRSGPRRT